MNLGGAGGGAVGQEEKLGLADLIELYCLFLVSFNRRRADLFLWGFSTRLSERMILLLLIRVELEGGGGEGGKGDTYDLPRGQQL